MQVVFTEEVAVELILLAVKQQMSVADPVGAAPGGRTEMG